MMRNIETEFIGLCDYSRALGMQQEHAGRLLENSQLASKLFGLEHPAVITLGKRAKAEDEIAVSPGDLQLQNIAVHESSRGGHATLHGPGQLVVYPVVRLSDLGFGVRAYVAALEKATQTFLQEFGISSRAGENGEPGLYTEQGKIAFFGIRVSRGIATHGISINVKNDLELFETIRSCGKTGETFARMADFGIELPIRELFFKWTAHFLRPFA
jgi:lipoyl(octanoyl) transferase